MAASPVFSCDGKSNERVRLHRIIELHLGEKEASICTQQHMCIVSVGGVDRGSSFNFPCASVSPVHLPIPTSSHPIAPSSILPEDPLLPPVKPRAKTARHPLIIVTMSDDNEPQGPSNNPFIRFKNHVNARIGTGVSVFTGTTDDRDRPPSNTQPANHNENHNGSGHSSVSSPWPTRKQSHGSLSELNSWNDWVHVDPYSPHNLQYLPQPTPRDLPSGADPADFGFPEAFEDLMTVSNPFRGHLMDLGMRAGLKRSPGGRLVQPETPSDWVRRLYGDALLPSPFIWEQPRLAGVIPRPWAAQGEQPASGAHGTQHGNDDIDDIARAYLEVMRQIDRIDSSVGDSLSKFEDILGRYIVDMIRNGQKVAGEAVEAFIGERPKNHNAESSDGKTHDRPKPASVSEEDQPETEEDLFEMIESASAEADKFFSTFGFGKTSARQAPPPAERTARDTPPVKETVEYDPFGGKTIRSCSEHVDMFGSIHSRTEVRRLNAKGETMDYDTRYSVRSGGDRPRPEEYRPRPDAPVSVLMTPEQYTTFIGKSSDEQLESFRLSTANTDEATLNAENLALKDRQMQLILQEQERRARQREEQAERKEAANHAIQDYHMQLMLLEQQNKRRLLLARDAELKLLEEHGKERLRRAREEESEARPAPEKPQEKASGERSGWFWR